MTLQRVTSAGADWSGAFATASADSARTYDEVMVPRLFEPWAELLLDQLELGPGESVLDVACGPGSVTRLVAGRVGAGARVVGCDVSAAMLARARDTPAPGDSAAITYVEAPADRLPIDDGGFDVVTCQQGMQFFADRPAAAAEMHRALRGGGRLGVAVWVEIERCPAFAVLADAIEEVLGIEAARRYRGGPWGFPSAEQLGALLSAAGFLEVEVTRHGLPVTFAGGAAQLVATLGASVLADDLGRLPEQGQRQLVESVARALGDGEIRSRAESNIALARA